MLLILPFCHHCEFSFFLCCVISFASAIVGSALSLDSGSAVICRCEVDHSKVLQNRRSFKDHTFGVPELPRRSEGVHTRVCIGMEGGLI